MALVGYARVSTHEQETSLQQDALEAAGCERIFADRASGALAERPELARALEYARQGDTLVVWRLDRLGREVVPFAVEISRCPTRPTRVRDLHRHRAHAARDRPSGNVRSRTPPGVIGARLGMPSHA